MGLATLSKYVRRHNPLQVDVHALWKALDRDCDGVVFMENLSMPHAKALASFHLWAHKHFGSCSAVWDHEELVRLRMSGAGSAWVSEKKMQGKTFLQALRQLEWDGPPETGKLLASSLDYYNCGLVQRSDLEWLDKWTPPEWLSAS